MSVKEYMDMLQIENSKLSKENSQLKMRIGKAIEYIEKNMYFYDGMQNEDRNVGLFENDINDLLKILKGDKE